MLAPVVINRELTLLIQIATESSDSDERTAGALSKHAKTCGRVAALGNTCGGHRDIHALRRPPLLVRAALRALARARRRAKRIQRCTHLWPMATITVITITNITLINY